MMSHISFHQLSSPGELPCSDSPAQGEGVYSNSTCGEERTHDAVAGALSTLLFIMNNIDGIPLYNQYNYTLGFSKRELFWRYTNFPESSDYILTSTDWCMIADYQFDRK